MYNDNSVIDVPYGEDEYSEEYLTGTPQVSFNIRESVNRSLMNNDTRDKRTRRYANGESEVDDSADNDANKNKEETPVITHKCPKMDCQHIIGHIDRCPLCRAYMRDTNEKKYYIIIAVLVAIIIILLLKKKFI